MSADRIRLRHLRCFMAISRSGSISAMPLVETSLVPAVIGLVHRDVPSAIVKVSAGPIKYLRGLLLDLIVGHLPAPEYVAEG